MNAITAGTRRPFRMTSTLSAAGIAAVLCAATVAQAMPARVNDSGQTRCYAGIIDQPDDAINAINAIITTNPIDAIDIIDCNSFDWPGQDGSFGRDAAYMAGTLNKVGAGEVAFDFTKVSAAGQDLPANATFSGGWACTRDNVTGLL